MSKRIDVCKILEPNATQRCLFASEEKLYDHVEKHLCHGLSYYQSRTRQEEWWDLLGNDERWKEFTRQHGKDPIHAVRKGDNGEADDAFLLLCQLYEAFAEKELKDACLVRRTDHYHRLALNQKMKPIGQIIQLFSPKNIFIAADFYVRNDGFTDYALCTCYRMEPSMTKEDRHSLHRQRQFETEFVKETGRWYAFSSPLADHNPENRAKNVQNIGS